MDFRRLFSRTRLLLVGMFCILGHTSFGQVAGSDWAEQVGYSRYNKLFYPVSANTIAYYPATGDISIIWTYARGINPFGRTVGYNHYNKRSNRWLWSAGINNPGSMDDSCNYQLSPLVPSCSSLRAGVDFDNGRVGWPNLIWDGQREAVVSYTTYLTDPSGLTRIHTMQPRSGAYLAQMPQGQLAVDTVRRDLTKDAVFHVTASAGANNYLLTYSDDTLNNQGLLDGGTSNSLILYHSTNLGTTWTPNIVPFINVANGVKSIANYGYTIDARNDMVAIVVQTFVTPDIGIATYLLKSSYRGQPGTWTSRLISRRVLKDSIRIGGLLCLPTDDGEHSVLIDNNGKVHVSAHAGLWELDSAIAGFTRRHSINGGFQNASSSRLYYWNEDMDDNTGYRTLCSLVDVNRNGRIDIVDYGLRTNPGTYSRAGLSDSKLSVDQSNNLYITYSACVEGSAPTYNRNTTRDIYVVASYNGGLNWTNPINIAGRLAITNCFTSDDGSSGSGSYEEAFPSVIKRIGSDEKLHLTFSSGSEAGFGYRLFSSTGILAPYMISYKAINLRDIEGSFLKANLPTQVCAGATIPITVSAPTNRVCSYGPLTSSTVFRAELDTTGKSTFNQSIILGTFTGNPNGGTISARFPNNWSGSGYIRIVANNEDLTANPIRYQSTTGEYTVYVSSGSPAVSPTNIIVKSGGVAVVPNANICSSKCLRIQVDSSVNANLFDWFISPTAAGTIQPNGDPYFGPTRSAVILNPNYQGPVNISVRARNACGPSAQAAYTVNVVGGTAQYQSTGVMTTNLVGGQWLYASSIRSPFAPLSPPQLSSTFDLRTSGQANGYYRYDVGTCQSNILYYSPTLGLSTEAASIAFQVYPNPATDAFRIEAALKDGPAEVVIYNGVGQVVHHTKLLGGERQPVSREINTAGLGRGVYMVRVSNGQSVSVQRLVLK